MKKLILPALFLFFCFSLLGQDNTYSHEGRYYRVVSDVSFEHARDAAQKMDAYFSFYGSYFHFDPALLEGRLNLRLFGSKERFDEYLLSIVPETRNSFVFLQYSDELKNELLGFISGEPEKDEIALCHYGFVQYLKSFIPNPPLWLQMGFAVYFEKSFYDAENNRITYVENLDWLNTAKRSLGEVSVLVNAKAAVLSSLLTMTPSQAEEDMETAYARSWGLVYFLQNTDLKEYNRLLWDSVSAMEKAASRRENETKIDGSAFQWICGDSLFSDFSAFILEMKTFPELIQAGIKAYDLRDHEAAEEYFLRASERESSHPLPYYYLGLISYIQKNYVQAKTYYEQSLSSGGEESLALYALGVNAYAAGEIEAAKDYLEQSFRLAPEGHGAKALELLNRIEAEEL